MARRLPFLLLLLALSFLPHPLRAAEVSGVRAELDGAQVLVSLRLANGFDRKLVERVESGLPTTLIYELVLSRDRKRWLDRDLEEVTLTMIGIYDAVRREYLVNTKLDGRLLESKVVHDLEALKKAMTEVERLPAFALEPSSDSRRVLVWVRAELGTAHLLGFIPRSVTTGWAESNKFRPPPEPVQ